MHEQVECLFQQSTKNQTVKGNLKDNQYVALLALKTETKKDLEILYKLLIHDPTISIPKQIKWDLP